jgi:Fusaric acid resistance protein-like
MGRDGSGMSFPLHVKRAFQPEPVPAMIRVGVAVLVDMIVVLVVVRGALTLAGYPDQALTHAALPAVFGGMFGFLGSLGGTLRSGVLRALILSTASLPLTLIAIAVFPWPIASALALGAAALFTGMLAWRGEPYATLGVILIYMYFIPFVFGAGRGVPLEYLLLSFAVMIVCTVALRALAAVVPKHQAPARVKVTGDPPGRPTTRRHFTLVPEPQLTRLRRTTVRSAIGLGLGAFALSWWGDHNAVWVLMTLIALIPPSIPLTIDRVLQRLAGTVLAMVFLTVVDVMIPMGSGRLVVIAVGLVVTIAYLRRSYALSVLGISCVAVLAYAGVTVPLGEALLWRGLDTVVGAVIAITMTLLIPVGRKPQPVWAHDSAALTT